MPDNSLCHEIDTGKRYYFANKAWHEAPARGGSGDGEGSSSLPANFPTEGTANANKFAGFDENGLWTAKDAPSGGSAEKFIVTLTQDEQTEEWTADKTVAEIVAADEAGKIVVAKYPVGEGMNTEIQLVVVDDAQGVIAAIFAGIDVFNENKSVVSVACINQGEEDAIQVEEIPIPASTNAPLIVMLTADGSTGNFVGDKTNGEVYSAFNAGKAVVLSASVGSSTFKLAVQYASYDGTDYEFAFIDSTAIKNTISGGANDYVTASLT